MRRIMAFDRVTADGYFTSPDGKLDWVVPEPQIDKEAGEGMSGQGSILFGRRTYEMFQAYWPHALEDSATAPDPHMPGRRSPEIRAMAVWINEAAKTVFSKTLEGVTWKNSRLLRTFDPREVEAMKKQPGPDMLVFGSGSIASQLTQHGLIDEYRFIVGPVLLGGGKSLISGLTKSSRLDFLEARAYPSGNVMLRYAPHK
ncbi:MAG TPA: dihydrofolate reductase family protein [Vicinamibacteria bacterium]|nr:dihydrofolate reductase family protein [Vicinamibacteria bacterium]